MAENIYLQIINCAKKYVYITTPYLILDNEMTTALTIAAESGVDVRIITPHIPDKWYVHAVTRSVIQSVKQDILKTMEISQEIHPNPDERVPLLRRLGRAILKAFAPLM